MRRWGALVMMAILLLSTLSSGIAYALPAQPAPALCHTSPPLTSAHAGHQQAQTDAPPPAKMAHPLMALTATAPCCSVVPSAMMALVAPVSLAADVALPRPQGQSAEKGLSVPPPERPPRAAIS